MSNVFVTPLFVRPLISLLQAGQVKVDHQWRVVILHLVSLFDSITLTIKKCTLLTIGFVNNCSWEPLLHV